MFTYNQDAVLTDGGPGCVRKILSYDSGIMMCEITFEEGAVGAKHAHPHMQVTYIVEGSFAFTVGGETKVVKAGDSVYMPSNVEHGVECLEAGKLVDVFAPMREDFLEKQLIFLKPVFKEMIWGGKRLKDDWGYDIPGDDTGECWAIGAHPNGDCTVANGTFKGMTLSELWEKCPALFGNPKGDRFPLLVKIIDARSDLSIQVHPDDEYAGKNENGSLGKTECWYILDCPDDATLVIGHNATTKEELEDMIRGGRWNEFIREVPIHKGDFVQIDPGTVHAIKGGVMLLETQQSSDITYRVYDYDRLDNGKPRQLHIDKSIDVINVPATPPQDCIRSMNDLPVNTLNEMISTKYYKVFKITVDGDFSFDQAYDFLNMSVIDGEATVNAQPVKKGDHFIVPNGFGEVKITGNATFIASTPQG